MTEAKENWNSINKGRLLFVSIMGATYYFSLLVFLCVSISNMQSFLGLKTTTFIDSLPNLSVYRKSSIRSRPCVILDPNMLRFVL